MNLSANQQWLGQYNWFFSHMIENTTFQNRSFEMEVNVVSALSQTLFKASMIIIDGHKLSLDFACKILLILLKDDKNEGKQKRNERSKISYPLKAYFPLLPLSVLAGCIYNSNSRFESHDNNCVISFSIACKGNANVGNRKRRKSEKKNNDHVYLVDLERRYYFQVS